MPNQLWKKLTEYSYLELTKIPEPEYAGIDHPFNENEKLDLNTSNCLIESNLIKNFQCLTFDSSLNVIERLFYFNRSVIEFLKEEYDRYEALNQLEAKRKIEGELKNYEKQGKPSLLLVKNKERTYLSYLLIELSYLIIHDKFLLEINNIRHDGFLPPKTSLKSKNIDDNFSKIYIDQDEKRSNLQN